MIARRLGLALAVAGVLAAVAWFAVVPEVRPALDPGEAYGVDVSNHQGSIDWPSVAHDGVTFAYLKASEGRGYVDASFSSNWTGAAAAGVRRGAYHFFTLCATGREQAANFLRVVPPDATALPPAVDLEILDDGCHERPAVAAVDAELDAFVTAVEQAWGRPLLVYARGSWTGRYPVPQLADRLRWRTSFFVRPHADWAVWQVQYFARVDGISGRVDLDVARPELG